ncbi:SEC-C domain-containing protein [Occultella aeris]|uniref:SEC-C motif protein n=1 Tax=Occultella aeris TaxID=2761496 RepID=A0A7M4DJV2_9MICO|nr:SEC-C domain-containing protein [Occultella aeris]VZO37337.1 SEC-C motif protein [Occultella aeris]
MDPLSKLGRNERCWCGSGDKYKYCHGDHRPASAPGAPVPPDPVGGTYVSPTVTIANGALTIDKGGAPITMPTGAPRSRAVEYTNWDTELVRSASSADPPLAPTVLGRLRVEVMRRLAALPEDDQDPSDAIKQAIFHLAAESLRTVSALAAATPKPSVLWNEELDPAVFLGRTLLLADHIAMPDHVFQSLVRRASNRALRRAAEQHLVVSELVAMGVVIPVPMGVAMAVGGSAVVKLTDADLNNPALVSWVRQQLILEGPTAREALLVRAADDFSKDAEKFWFHAHIDPESVKNGDGRFESRMLQPYDPNFDYAPWIKQVSDSAVGYYVQRTNERAVTSDVYGAEYVAASLFEARLLSRRRSDHELVAAQAALWADVPQLPSLSGPDLVKVLQNEEAVEDLRRQVRASLTTARAPGEQTDALTDLAHQLEASSHKLEKFAASDRLWQAALPGGLGTASLLIGTVTGGIPAIAAGSLGLLAGVAPYLGARASRRREAAYLFVAARRRSRRGRARRSG